MSDKNLQVRALELYSGIGGMHYALKASNLCCDAEVVAAVDISPLANSVYCYNFPQTLLLEKGIEGFSVKELNQLQFNLLLMSPPCQPFTRIGLKKDIEDPRTKSFLHLLKTLPQLNEPPSYILLENVKGFEDSKAFKMFCDILDELNYNRQCFLVSPKDLGIPNSRLRFYLIARRKPLSFDEVWSQPDEVLEFLPNLNGEAKTPLEDTSMSSEKHYCNPLKNFLEKDESLYEEYKVSETTIERYLPVMDVVSPESTGSNCFTKSYGHYIEGTGSILFNSLSKSHLSEEQKNDLSSRRLRYFTPREIANIMGFPKEFDFLKETTRKQKYRLLGNSLSVNVVACLLNLLVK